MRPCLYSSPALQNASSLPSLLHRRLQSSVRPMSLHGLIAAHCRRVCRGGQQWRQTAMGGRRRRWPARASATSGACWATCMPRRGRRSPPWATTWSCQSPPRPPLHRRASLLLLTTALPWSLSVHQPRPRPPTLAAYKLIPADHFSGRGGCYGSRVNACRGRCCNDYGKSMCHATCGRPGRPGILAQAVAPTTI